MNFSTNALLSTATFLLVAAGTLSLASDAFAREGKARGDGYTRETTVTNDRGETRTKKVEGSYDREKKQLDRKITGYDGQERSTTTIYDPENKTFNTQGSNGGTRTTNFNDGKKTTTTTGPNGKSLTSETTYDRDNKTITRQNSAGGSSVTNYGDGQSQTTYTGPNGKTATSQTVRNGDGTATTTYTGPNGRTGTAETVIKRKAAE